MIIFISISELLDGIASISKKKKYKFIGVDSSFTIDFEIINDYILLKNIHNTFKIQCLDFYNTLYNSSLVFYNKNISIIGYEDAVMTDYKNSLVKFKNSML